MISFDVCFDLEYLFFFSFLQENMIVRFEDQDSGRCSKGSPSGNENCTTKMCFQNNEDTKRGREKMATNGYGSKGKLSDVLLSFARRQSKKSRD